MVFNYEMGKIWNFIVKKSVSLNKRNELETGCLHYRKQFIKKFVNKFV